MSRDDLTAHRAQQEVLSTNYRQQQERSATYRELTDKMDENIARVKELKADLKLCRKALEKVIETLDDYALLPDEQSAVHKAEAALARARQWEGAE